MEICLRSALERCAGDDAAPNDIIHMYLECDGFDFCFAHNPPGIHGMTLQSLSQQQLCNLSVSSCV